MLKLKLHWRGYKQINTWKDVHQPLWWWFISKSCPTLATSWIVTCQVPLSMGLSREEYLSGLPFHSPWDLPDPRIKPTSPALASGFFTTEPPGDPDICYRMIFIFRKSTFISLGEVKVSQPCLTLCNLMDYTVYGILQARILEWVAFSFPRGSSQPRDRTQISCTEGGFFTTWATREAHEYWSG